jgi:hypothetical protein
MPWDTSIYRLDVDVTTGLAALQIDSGGSTAYFVDVLNLQIRATVDATDTSGARIALYANTASGTGVTSLISGCHIRGTYTHGSDNTGGLSLRCLNNGRAKDCVVVNSFFITDNTLAGEPTASNGFIGINLSFAGAGTADSVLYNNTVFLDSVGGAGTSLGLNSTAGDEVVAINNIGDGATTCFNNVDGTGTNYNASSDATATGAQSRTSQTFTYVTAGSDYHLAAGDTGAKTYGTDLSGDGTYPFSDDFDGDTRSAWDIGADEFGVSVVATDAFTLSLREIELGIDETPDGGTLADNGVASAGAASKDGPDSATVADASIVAAAIEDSDSGTLADTGALPGAESKTGTDTGTLAESDAGVSIPITGSDTAIMSDSAVVEALIAAVGTGTAAESTTADATGTISDVITFVSSTDITAVGDTESIVATDTAAWTESPLVAVTLSATDTATMTEIKARMELHGVLQGTASLLAQGTASASVDREGA